MKHDWQKIEPPKHTAYEISLSILENDIYEHYEAIKKYPHSIRRILVIQKGKPINDRYDFLTYDGIRELIEQIHESNPQHRDFISIEKNEHEDAHGLTNSDVYVIVGCTKPRGDKSVSENDRSGRKISVKI